jgi:xre family toxin-antitoxin system, antitoxin component
MLSLKYPNFEKDLLNEVTLQKVALRIIKMRLEQGLNQEQSAEKNGIIRTLLNRIESGHHNPTILSLVEIARQNGYEIEVRMKKKNF